MVLARKCSQDLEIPSAKVEVEDFPFETPNSGTTQAACSADLEEFASPGVSYPESCIPSQTSLQNSEYTSFQRNSIIWKYY